MGGGEPSPQFGGIFPMVRAGEMMLCGRFYWDVGVLSFHEETKGMFLQLFWVNTAKISRSRLWRSRKTRKFALSGGRTQPKILGAKPTSKRGASEKCGGGLFTLILMKSIESSVHQFSGCSQISNRFQFTISENSGTSNECS